MAFALSDRVKETTTTTGTGSVTLAGAATGFQTFNSGVGVGNTMYYCIAGQGTSEWEVGMGTLSASTTLARTKIFASSNAGSAVTFSAGTKDVFVTLPASAGYAGASAEVFTASGTFTIPTGITRVKVTIVGGGGGGGGSLNGGCCDPDYDGGGGGGGGAAVKWLTSLTPGNTLTVTRGAGGTGGNSSGTGGTSGGTSSVASGTETITTVSATGGAVGSGSSGDPGAGGDGASGDLNMRGSDGTFASSGPGNGGSSIMGGFVYGYTGGRSGFAYGGGGGGGKVTGGTATGGAGANGVIFFEW